MLKKKLEEKNKSHPFLIMLSLLLNIFFFFVAALFYKFYLSLAIIKKLHFKYVDEKLLVDRNKNNRKNKLKNTLKIIYNKYFTASLFMN